MAIMLFVLKVLAHLIPVLWVVVQQTYIVKPKNKLHFGVIFLLMLIFDYLFYLAVSDFWMYLQYEG